MANTYLEGFGIAYDLKYVFDPEAEGRCLL